MRIRPTERMRCVKKQPSYPIHATTLEAFKEHVMRLYEGFSIAFIRSKARINPFSPARVKLHWVKI
jgi:hypothetical protein